LPNPDGDHSPEDPFHNDDPHPVRVDRHGRVLVHTSRNQVQGWTSAAMIWSDGAYIDIGSLSPAGEAHRWIIARDMNDRGQVVGQALAYGVDESRGFMWHRGEMTDLGVLEPGDHMSAHMIGDSGHVIGFYSATRDGVDRHGAFVAWCGRLVDLGAMYDEQLQLPLLQSNPADIDARGRIVWAKATASGWRAMLSTPTYR
jgi:probable HAF family extracellular repeat protein